MNFKNEVLSYLGEMSSLKAIKHNATSKAINGYDLPADLISGIKRKIKTGSVRAEVVEYIIKKLELTQREIGEFQFSKFLEKQLGGFSLTTTKNFGKEEVSKSIKQLAENIFLAYKGKTDIDAKKSSSSNKDFYASNPDADTKKDPDFWKKHWKREGKDISQENIERWKKMGVWDK